MSQASFYEQVIVRGNYCNILKHTSQRLPESGMLGTPRRSSSVSPTWLPTTRWVPGQVVADSYEIPLSEDAPAGPLSLYVGMYDRLNMVRLPVLDEEGTTVGDAVIVATIEVIDGTD